MWGTHTMGHSSAVKKKEILTYVDVSRDELGKHYAK